MRAPLAFQGVCEAFFLRGDPTARAVLGAYESALGNRPRTADGSAVAVDAVAVDSSGSGAGPPGVADALVPESPLEAAARAVGLRRGAAGEWLIDGDAVPELERVKRDGAMAGALGAAWGDVALPVRRRCHHERQLQVTALFYRQLDLLYAAASLYGTGADFREPVAAAAVVRAAGGGPHVERRLVLWLSGCRRCATVV